MNDEITENESDVCDKGIRAVIALVIGLSGIIGLFAAAILRIPLPFAFVFIVLAAVGMPFGLMRLKRKERKGRAIIIAAVVSVITAPVYVPVGIGIGLLVPVLPSYVRVFLVGPDVVRSVMSPDGKFEAYVVEQPSIDPPNQSLYIQRSDNIHFRSIAKLDEDIDSIKDIHWSGESDIVVFHTRCNLIAVSLPGYQTVRIPLGQEWIRTKASKRSTFTGAGPRVVVADVRFTAPDSFSYRLEGSDLFRVIPIGSL